MTGIVHWMILLTESHSWIMGSEWYCSLKSIIIGSWANGGSARNREAEARLQNDVPLPFVGGALLTNLLNLLMMMIHNQQVPTKGPFDWQIGFRLHILICWVYRHPGNRRSVQIWLWQIYLLWKLLRMIPSPNRRGNMQPMAKIHKGSRLCWDPKLLVDANANVSLELSFLLITTCFIETMNERA